MFSYKPIELENAAVRGLSSGDKLIALRNYFIMRSWSSAKRSGFFAADSLGPILHGGFFTFRMCLASDGGIQAAEPEFRFPCHHPSIGHEKPEKRRRRRSPTSASQRKKINSCIFIFYVINSKVSKQNVEKLVNKVLNRLHFNISHAIELTNETTNIQLVIESIQMNRRTELLFRLFRREMQESYKDSIGWRWRRWRHWRPGWRWRHQLLDHQFNGPRCNSEPIVNHLSSMASIQFLGKCSFSFSCSAFLSY